MYVFIHIFIKNHEEPHKNIHFLPLIIGSLKEREKDKFLYFGLTLRFIDFITIPK